jgi:hypothetical protein
MSKKPSLPALVRKADKLFSEYIRNRDATQWVQDETGLSVKAGNCITCYKLVAINQAHCGHFIQRGCKTTRFDQRNASLQCPRCNVFRYGEQYKHGLAIDAKFGEGTAQELLDKEIEYYKSGYKYTRQELEEIIERYRDANTSRS